MNRKTPRFDGKALGQTREQGQRFQIAAEQRFDARTQHLDRRLGAFRCGGAMDLRDGGGGDRRAEGGKQIFDGVSQTLRDGGARNRIGKRRQAVLQMLQRARDVFAHDIGPRRQHLARA